MITLMFTHQLKGEFPSLAAVLLLEICSCLDQYIPVLG